MSATKDFHIGDILSITTGRLVSLDHIGGVYKILDWMTGESLMTHQLPRVSRECEPILRGRHPDLAAVTVPDDLEGEAQVWAWLAAQVEIFGETRPVAPMAAADHTMIDPLAEISMNYPHLQVIELEVPGE